MVWVWSSWWYTTHWRMRCGRGCFFFFNPLKVWIPSHFGENTHQRSVWDVCLCMRFLCACLFSPVLCAHHQTGSLAGGITAGDTWRVHCTSGEKEWTCVYRKKKPLHNKTHSCKSHTLTQACTSNTWTPLYQKDQRRKNKNLWIYNSKFSPSVSHRMFTQTQTWEFWFRHRDLHLHDSAQCSEPQLNTQPSFIHSFIHS